MPTLEFCIGMDYNANINWIVCGQPRGNRLNVLKSFYVKFERKIPALIADFCTYYAPHANTVSSITMMPLLLALTMP
mgnify:FL=1|jgi:ABC-type amino acid transport system permease subunit